MENNSFDFFEHLTQAQYETLRPQDNAIFSFYFGTGSGDLLTLQQIADIYGLSRERIRQILQKCLRKLTYQTTRHYRARNVDHPCVILAKHIYNNIIPGDPKVVNGIAQYALNYLPHLPPKTHALKLVAAFGLIKVNWKQLINEAGHILEQLLQEQRQAKKLKERQDLLISMLEEAIFLSHASSLSKEDYHSLHPKRAVNKNSKSISGEFYSSKMNRMIQYESSLERNFLLDLEALSNVILYVEQPFRIEYVANTNKKSYFPDIFILLSNGIGIVIEIKPIFYMGLKYNLTKWSALKEFCQKHGFGILITDGQHTITRIMHDFYDQTFCATVIDKLAQGPLDWKTYQPIKKEFSASRNEFISMILKHKLVWELSPFKLSLPS